jgi:hypothetical protein
MKLGELKVAIRTMKGNPLVQTTLPGGKQVWVAAQKGSLMEALNSAFEHKASETGLALTNAGKLCGVEGHYTLQIDLEDYVAASTPLLDLDI